MEGEGRTVTYTTAAQRQAVSDWLTKLQGMQGIGKEIDWIALANNIAEAVVEAKLGQSPEAHAITRPADEAIQQARYALIEAEYQGRSMFNPYQHRPVVLANEILRLAGLLPQGGCK